MSSPENLQTLPVLPIKNTVLFPSMLKPLNVGRPSSIAAIEAALASEGKEIVVVAQRDTAVDSPSLTDLYSIGTKAGTMRASIDTLLERSNRLLNEMSGHGAAAKTAA